jgi:hypothetical protein
VLVGDRPDPGGTLDFLSDSVLVFLVSAVEDAGVDGQFVGNGAFIHQSLGDLNVVLVEFRGVGCPVVACTYYSGVFGPESIDHVNHTTSAPDVRKWGNA